METHILIRHCFPYRNYGTSYPENSILFKYFPKYYKNLSIDITRQSSLLSKIKRIKRLTSFKGFLNEDKEIPQNLWFSLFKSHRKQIEELPEKESSRSSLKRFLIKEIKFFYNIKRLHLSTTPKGISPGQWNYLSNTRGLKSLKISLARKNEKDVKDIIGKLNHMERLLNQLERLELSIHGYDPDIQELFQNKNFMGYLTHLDFENYFNTWFPFLGMIPHACKNLRSLSIGFGHFFHKNHEFTDFLTSLRVEGLNLRIGKKMEEFLKAYKPQASLRYLKLTLDISMDCSQDENFVNHWEDLNQLETLNLDLTCENAEILPLMRFLVTKILAKAQKLKSFECSFVVAGYYDKTPSYELPLFIDQVPHLYESLEKFNVIWTDYATHPGNVNWNLGILEAFKNLKEIKIKGENLRLTNMKGVINLLENKALSRLTLKRLAIDSNNDLDKILEEISSTHSQNLKIKLEVDFTMSIKEEREELEGLCKVITSAKPMKGLLFSLNMYRCADLTMEKMKNILRKFPEIQNCSIRMSSPKASIMYRKIGGNKGELIQL